jgi:hypothetical protein
MEPKGVFNYVLSSNFDTEDPPLLRWIPWQGTQSGFAGTTLFSAGGTALDTSLAGASILVNSAARFLGVNSLDYGIFGASAVARQNLVDNADANATLGATGVLGGAVARLQGFNGTTWDRLRSFAGNADALAAPTLGLLGIKSFVTAFNGTTYDRLRTNSAATLSASTQSFAMLAASPGEWSVNHTPAANTVATITRAAGAAGVRHVCRSISATLIGLAAAAEATVLVNLRDGATGAGTILWSTRLLVTGTTGSETGITLANLNVIGSAATAMTIEFAAAGGANTFEAVAITGYDTI